MVLVGVLAVTLCEAHARAGWWPPERPPTSVEGPWGTRWTVVKVAPSPLPNDGRLCAYLQS